MYDRVRIRQLLEHIRPGHSLPQPFYCDHDVHEFDLDAIFYRSWIMVGFEVQLPQAGSFLATQVGRSPIVIIRNPSGGVSAFHNVCRHRGAQICATGSGRSHRLVCPYHQWSYGLDGKLLSARGAASDFDVSAHALTPVRVEIAAGCIYVSLGDDAPDFAPFRRALEPALRPHNLHAIKLAHSVEYLEQANWKLVMENARECHHCAARHPEFISTFPRAVIEDEPLLANDEASISTRALRGLGVDTDEILTDWWQLGRYPFKPGFRTFSLDGAPLVRKPLSELNEGYLGTLRWAIEPNNFCHATSDSVFTFNANPTGPQSTLVTARWFVHEDAVEGEDYEPERLSLLWHTTNLQDRDLAENNQRGVNGAGYIPGRYCPHSESYVLRFIDWYRSEAARYLQTSAAAAVRI